MLFGRRKGKVRRILVVEDEPLVAFDNEHVLGDAGYEVVAAVDNVAEAVRLIGRDGIDLVIADVSLSDGGDGIEVARAAHARGIPLLFATGGCPKQAQELAVGCLAKPYSPRDLLQAIAAVEARLSGREPKRKPAGLTLFGPASPRT